MTWNKEKDGAHTDYRIVISPEGRMLKCALREVYFDADGENFGVTDVNGILDINVMAFSGGTITDQVLSERLLTRAKSDLKKEERKLESLKYIVTQIEEALNKPIIHSKDKSDVIQTDAVSETVSFLNDPIRYTKEKSEKLKNDSVPKTFTLNKYLVSDIPIGPSLEFGSKELQDKLDGKLNGEGWVRSGIPV